MNNTEKKLEYIKQLSKQANQFSQRDAIGTVIEMHVEVLRICFEKGVDNQDIHNALSAMKDERILKEYKDLRKDVPLRKLVYDITEATKLAVESLIDREKKRQRDAAMKSQMMKAQIERVLDSKFIGEIAAPFEAVARQDNAEPSMNNGFRPMVKLEEPEAAQEEAGNIPQHAGNPIPASSGMGGTVKNQRNEYHPLSSAINGVTRSASYIAEQAWDEESDVKMARFMDNSDTPETATANSSVFDHGNGGDDQITTAMSNVQVSTSFGLDKVKGEPDHTKNSDKTDRSKHSTPEAETVSMSALQTPVKNTEVTRSRRTSIESSRTAIQTSRHDSVESRHVSSRISKQNEVSKEDESMNEKEASTSKASERKRTEKIEKKNKTSGSAWSDDELSEEGSASSEDDSNDEEFFSEDDSNDEEFMPKTQEEWKRRKKSNIRFFFENKKENNQKTTSPGASVRSSKVVQKPAQAKQASVTPSVTSSVKPAVTPSVIPAAPTATPAATPSAPPKPYKQPYKEQCYYCKKHFYGQEFMDNHKCPPRPAAAPIRIVSFSYVGAPQPSRPLNNLITAPTPASVENTPQPASTTPSVPPLVPKPAKYVEKCIYCVFPARFTAHGLEYMTKHIKTKHPDKAPP